MRRAPVVIESARLTMRRPGPADAAAIFERYASDPEITRYMAWPVHRTIDDTHAFIAFSDAEWRQWPAGPYLIEDRIDGRLLGSTGFAFEQADRAITGYILARDAWGRGYATEALRAMVEVAPTIGIRTLTASCYAGHPASARVLEKGGFRCEGLLPRHTVFPNMDTRERLDVLAFVRAFA